MQPGVFIACTAWFNVHITDPCSCFPPTHTHSLCDTPKRRKHAPLEKIPSFASDVSSDAGESLNKLLSLLIDAVGSDAQGDKCKSTASPVTKCPHDVVFIFLFFLVHKYICKDYVLFFKTFCFCLKSNPNLLFPFKPVGYLPLIHRYSCGPWCHFTTRCSC